MPTAFKTALASALTFATLTTCAGMAAAQQPVAPTTISDFPNADDGIRSLLYRGLTAKRVARSLADAPDAPETLELLIAARRTDDALRVLRRIVDTRPDHLARALEFLPRLTWDVRSDDIHGRADVIRELITRARSRLVELPREHAARAARVLLTVGELRPRPTNDYSERLQPFIQEYAGTEAAALAEVDAISARRTGLPSRLQALEAFAREHPGTVAAAKALYQRGFDLAANGMSAGIEPPRGDPLKRFLMVHEIVTELESGAYPPCEWRRKAPELMVSFSAYQPAYEPGSIAKMVDGYERFVKSHFALHNQTVSSGIGYVITRKMAELYAASGEGDAGVDRLLADIGRTPGNQAAARYLLAEFYLLPRTPPRPESERRELVAKAADVLAALVAQPDGVYQRRALARLAILQFSEGAYASAVEHLSAFLKRYPTSEWAWVAALRLGHAYERLDNWMAALEAYRGVAGRYADVPPARVLAHAYAARAHEALGQFDQALAQHERTLAYWDDDYGETYSLYLRRPARPEDSFGIGKDVAEVAKGSLAARVAQLKQALSAPGSALLERGRWLFAREELDEAAAALARLLKEHPRSPLANEARTLSHRVRVTRALERADAQELERLAREPYDFWICAAKISRAAMLWRNAAVEDAQGMMQHALEEWHAWHARQSSTIARAPSSDLERDVLEIRNLVFRPGGDGLFAGTRWELNSLLPPQTPFLVARESISVKPAGGRPTSVRVDRPIPGFENVLFFDAEQVAFFDMLLAKVGGTERRQPRAVMEVPNQPVGGSIEVLNFLKRFFPARPGHWGGWMIETFPMITDVEFVDPDRTKAAVRVTIGYEGCTVVLEKKGGAWTFERITNRWIT